MEHLCELKNCQLRMPVSYKTLEASAELHALKIHDTEERVKFRQQAIAILNQKKILIQSLNNRLLECPKCNKTYCPECISHQSHQCNQKHENEV